MNSLIELIQKNLGYQAIQKIDPNTQEIKTEGGQMATRSLTQAAIPAVVVALCDRLKSAETPFVFQESDSTNWLDSLFGKSKKDLVTRIADYSGANSEVAQQETEHIANEAVRLARESIPHPEDAAAISQFATEQRTYALLYLPAALQLGALLNNNPLDDRTHKMEGPISSLMHSVEKQF